VFVFAIPFSQPIIAMNSLMFGQVAIVLVGIAYEIVVALVTIFVAVHLFKKDILLTGRVKSAEAKRRGTYSLWTMMKRK
jgi:ABC-2 type transport system permease protein